MELKRKVVRGVAWSTAEKVLSALLQLAVSLILLQKLSGEDYGTIAVIAAFPAVLLSLVDSGFSQALIRKKEVDDLDYSSVFFVNVTIAVTLYLILLAFTPLMARLWSDIALFTTIAPILFLIFPINSLVIIQQTILAREMDFRRLSIYSFTASVVSSAAAIVLAVCGYGIWALVAQRLMVVITKSILLWVGSRWRPVARFSFDRIKGMFRYSSRILLSDLVSNIYYQIQAPIIGAKYTIAQTGYYDRGNKIKELPVTSTIQAVMGVAFPALSQLQDQPEKLARSARKILSIWVFVMFPLMTGLIVTSPDLFRWLLPERWLNSIPYLQILSIAGLMSPLSVISYVLVKVRSDGKLIFRIEWIKKIFATAVLLVTVPIGVKAIAWGQVIVFASDMLINTFTANYLVREWSVWKIIGSLLPYATLTVVMGAAIWGVQLLTHSIGAGWSFGLEVVAGVGIYAALSRLLRLEAWDDTLQIVKEYIAKLRKGRQ